MKIIKRIAEQQYCFTELSFDSLEEYNKSYPEFMRAYVEMQKKIDAVKLEKPPFESPHKFQDQHRKEQGLTKN